MKRQIKIAVSACFLAACLAIRCIKYLFGSRDPQRLTILYYHAVRKSSLAGFERQMAMLARRARVVPADWDGDGPNRASAHRRSAVAIVFDDAFESVFDNAVPVLEAYGFRCTVFVPSGCIGQPPSWMTETDADATERVASAERLSHLSGDVVTIGSHTVTHPRLSSLSREAARREIVQSMQDLSALTGKTVTSLAFPYGDHNDDLIELCRSSGYRQVYTIEPVPVLPGSGAFARGRVAVDPGDGRFEFLLKMSGAYQWMSVVSAAKKWLLTPSPRKRPRQRPAAGIAPRDIPVP
jgi:peptidoglycan/xylan/chitin deacetylase (PgdA/CDA1 family)